MARPATRARPWWGAAALLLAVAAGQLAPRPAPASAAGPPPAAAPAPPPPPAPAVSLPPGPAVAPAFVGDFPDPDVITVASAYWGYSTDSAGRNIQAIASADLVHWYGPIDALPTLPSWAVAGLTWAPGVVELLTGYVMYYAVHDAASGRQCLSVATSATPQGPFVDRSSGPLVCQLTVGGSIDPSPFIAPDGRLYLLWKSEDNAFGDPTRLWAQLVAPGAVTLAGSPSLLLTESAPWQTPTVEGPAMVALDGRDYLFYGANLWKTSQAGIGYAVCTSPVGPCTDETTAGPWMGTHGPIIGPAGPAPFRDANGATDVAFHAWTGPVGYVNGGHRSLWIAPLTFAAGYRAVSRDGGVFAFGAAAYLGAASSVHPRAPIVAMAQAGDGAGYWQVGSDGGVFAYGSAPFLGSTGALRLRAPVVGVMASPTGGGYALVARDGGLFTFGDFGFRGSDGGVRSPVPVVGGATSGLLDGPGYWLARADGTVDAFGAAPALGSYAGGGLHAPIVAIAAAPSGIGYWLVGSDGGVQPFGAARSYGAPVLGPHDARIVGIVPTPTGSGYWLLDAGGGVFSFGDAGFAGSLGGVKLAAPVVGGTGTAAGPPVCGC